MNSSGENGAGTSAGTAGTALDYLQSVYRNPLQPDNVRMRAAAIAIEYELPRLAVTATVNGGDFAVRLDQAIERSRMIEAKPITNVSSENVSSEESGTKTHANGKPMIPDRRYRRW